MLEHLMVPASQVITIAESFNLQSALEVLEKHQLRCAPVIDNSGQLYRGNIYRYHIYKYAYEHPDTQLETIPVTHLLKNSSHVIQEPNSILHLFFAIRDLPYIAVLNEQRSFIGIIYHKTMRDYIVQGWDLKNASYFIQIDLQHTPFEEIKLWWLMRRHLNVTGQLTFEETTYDTPNCLCLLIPNHISDIKVNQFIHHLTKRDYRVNSYPI
ncbi:cyclic di-AMP binding protein CbpA [Falseniella ignava]|uniref:CBS domain-containing protein n=1 Tax=Falseniella ignava CCUG 37419 TaxID=883112 RepID=K1LVQ4_9LACT|nr:cyclic di-AMP binding protein CbpA [Falseniella ignava]EKB59036.1 hypothetical protein HMPREF9707_00114 [Falseniella ignava CCUG 37419]